MAPYHMPDTLDASQYEFPLAALIDVISSTEAESKWAELHSAQERAIAALENRRTELNGLYERAVAPDTSWEEITQVASMIGEWDAPQQKNFILRLTRFSKNSQLRVTTCPRRSDERARKV